MNNNIYKKLAKQNGITVKELKSEMQDAINQAYAAPNFFANCVPRKGETPTIDEFVEYTVRRVTRIGGKR